MERQTYAEVEAERARRPSGNPTPYRPGHKNYLEVPAPPPQPAHARMAVQASRAIITGVLGLLLFFLLTAKELEVSTRGWIMGAAVFFFVPIYLSGCDRTRPPSRFEIIVARCWLWFRRIIGCGTGLLIIAAALYSGARIANFWMSSGCLAFGAYLVYIGWFGQGNNQHRLRDDLDLHRENKKRYDW